MMAQQSMAPIYILDEQKWIAVNNKLIADHKIFAFLFCPDEELFIAIPQNYNRDGAISLFISLNRQYNEKGMKFIDAFTAENEKFSRHIHNSIRLRSGMFAHDPEPKNIETSDKIIKYYFRNRFDGCKKFWKEASDSDWKDLMNIFISESNSFYEYIEKIANGDIPSVNIRNKFSQNISNSMFSITNKCIAWVRLRLNEIRQSDFFAARDYIKKNKSVQDEICKELSRSLEKGIYKNSKDLYDGFTQIFAEHMRNYISELNANADDDMFE